MAVGNLDVLLEGCLISPTGSRHVCVPPPTDTDLDYIIWTAHKKYFTDRLISLGFVMDSDEDYRYKESDFSSLRLGGLNLIITDKKSYYNKFVMATKIAKKLNLIHKPDRIALFEEILSLNLKTEL